MGEQRVDYQNRLQTLVEELDREMWELRERAHEADEVVRPAYERRIEQLAARQRVAREALHRVMETDDDTWEALRPSVRETWQVLTAETGSEFDPY
jgi:hypothetical protein